ncbi:uracil-DNA glycosylase [Candidatus Woesearchaeota archaeon]|nr:MAG: uracil-DNA glycosylase [Candidatus Woesearchaeota archaeon]
MNNTAHTTGATNTTNAQALARLKERIQQELDCPLKHAATNLVFGKGNPDADIIFIGEAPGEQEDKAGEPFVGRAGKELDKLLHSIGLSLRDIYIANILKYRPPNNRDPTLEEIQRHTPYLIEQILIIKPTIIATLGNFATKFFLANQNPHHMRRVSGISALHGKPRHTTINGRHFIIFPLYHPASMLYKPPLRATLEEDFQRLRRLITAERAAQSTQQSLTNYS